VKHKARAEGEIWANSRKERQYFGKMPTLPWNSYSHYSQSGHIGKRIPFDGGQSGGTFDGAERKQVVSIPFWWPFCPLRWGSRGKRIEFSL